MPDSWRLAIGTLTRLPVPAPRVVDRRVAGRAIAWAPVVGLLLGCSAAVVLSVPGLLSPSGALTALLASMLAITWLAYATRAMHLDGLADTADALGSGRPAAQALDIARRSDIGPFGVVTLVLAIGLQSAALAVCTERGLGAPAVIGAVVAGRIALAWACTPLLPAARADGLGATVAGSVPVWVAIGWTALAVASIALVRPGWLVAGAAAALGAAIVLLIARRRLGGVTGDVLGATIEIAATIWLVGTALVA